MAKYNVKCSDLADKECDFVLEGENKEEVMNAYYAHGMDPKHAEKYTSASDEEKAEFGKKFNEYLDAQK
jgi:predicted small metal-binding protein